MVLTLMLGDTFQRFNLSDDDLDREPLELLHDIERLFERPVRPDDSSA